MPDYRLIAGLRAFIERTYTPSAPPVSLKQVPPPPFEPVLAPSLWAGAFLIGGLAASAYDKAALQRMIEEGTRFTNSFTARLFEHIDHSPYATDADFYNDIGISRQTFSRIKNPQNAGDLPSKKNILIMAIGLRLGVQETEELLHLAGYALRNNKKQDIIIKYFLTEGQYDRFLIDDALCQFGEAPFFSAA